MGPGMRIEVFDSLTLLGRRRWYFRIVSEGNNETLAQSEGYNSAAARDKTAIRLRAALGAPIIEGKQRGKIRRAM